MPEKIASDKLILVEGKDEINFLSAFLNYLGLKNIQILKVGGKDNFRKEFPVLLIDPGFNSVKIYGIIRDADESEHSTFQSITALLKKYKQPVPEKTGEFAQNEKQKVGIFVMPGNSDSGMLEDLCLQTVNTHPIMPCVEDYLSCLKDKVNSRTTAQQSEYKFPRVEIKAKAQTFLAGMFDSVNSVGLAALKGYWNFEHPSLNQFRDFLKEFDQK